MASKEIITIKNGISLQQLLDEAYSILGNPMLVFDMDYRLVAYTDVENDDPIWNEFIETGRLSPKTIEFSMTENFIDTAANSDGIAYLLVSEKLKYNRIIGQLYNNKNEPVADLAVVACKKPFEEEDQPLIRSICERISKQIGKDKYYLNYGKTYIENMIIRLIEDDFEDRRLYTDHVANIYRSFKKYIYVAAASISPGNPVHNLTYFKDLMRQTQPDFKYTIYHNHIVILFSSSYKTLRAERDLKKLSAFFEQENMHVGISNHFDNLFELPKYYAEAVAALNERERNSNERYHVYDLLA